MNTIFARTGKMALLSVLFFCIIWASAAQAPSGGQDVPSDETRIYLGTGDESAPGTAERGTESGIWVLLRIIIVLALVCAAIYGVVYLLKRSTRINVANDPYLKSVAQLVLAPNKSLHVVTIGAKAFLVGVTDQTINPIGEIDDRELIDAMNLSSARNEATVPASFAAILSNFLPAQSRAKKPVSGEGSGESAGTGAQMAESGIEGAESAAGTAEFIRRQRERLRDIGSEQTGAGGSGTGRQE